MNKSKFILSVFLISALNVIVGIFIFTIIMDNSGMINTKIIEKIPGQDKIINNKVIEEKVTKYTKLKDLQNDIIDTIDKSSGTVVSIIISKDLKVFMEDPNNFFGGQITERKEKVGGGSGIIITKDGYIITNKHVVTDPNADYSAVTKDGQTFKVSKIRLDPVIDIAILKITDETGKDPTDLPFAKILSVKEKVKIGELVIAIGNALAEFDNTATFGIISGKGRTLNPGENDSVYIGLYQTDTAINPGNSGGPLLDIDGNVIGINTAISQYGQNIGFTLPINDEFVTKTLESIKKKGQIIRPFVGVAYQDINKSLAKSMNLPTDKGIIVTDVTPGSVAQGAGVKKNDIITKIDGQDIDKDNPFLYSIYAHNPGEEVKLTLISGGTQKDVSIILGEYRQ